MKKKRNRKTQQVRQKSEPSRLEAPKHYSREDYIRDHVGDTDFRKILKFAVMEELYRPWGTETPVDMFKRYLDSRPMLLSTFAARHGLSKEEIMRQKIIAEMQCPGLKHKIDDHQREARSSVRVKISRDVAAVLAGQICVEDLFWHHPEASLKMIEAYKDKATAEKIFTLALKKVATRDSLTLSDAKFIVRMFSDEWSDISVALDRFAEMDWSDEFISAHMNELIRIEYFLETLRLCDETRLYGDHTYDNGKTWRTIGEEEVDVAKRLLIRGRTPVCNRTIAEELSHLFKA